jgi:ferredoxin-NADP reductase
MLFAKTLLWLGILLGAAVLCQLALLMLHSLVRTAGSAYRARGESDLLSQRLALGRLQLQRQENICGWNGTRKFKISRIVKECDGVRSFYLEPHDKRPLPGFYPGQYLTFELDIPGERKRVIRCYSLSDRPREDYYRVSIKHVLPPSEQPGGKPGLVSNFFHATLKEGDILDVKAPAGAFYLDTARTSPVVFLAGGVGVTPMISMLNDIAANAPQREVWMYYVVRNSSDHIMKEALETMARGNEKIHLHICYTRPLTNDTSGKDYHHQGRLTLDLLKQQLGSNNYDFYLCGPGPMMEEMHNALLEWNVPKGNIHLEAFGPASVKKNPPVDQPVDALKVTFSRSGREMSWTGEADSLLDFALAGEIPIGYGCRAGNCGTCKTAIKSGTVKYLKDPGCEVEAGSCLTCICVPESPLTLEA